MGTEFGYEYDYEFSMMDGDEVNPIYKSKNPKSNGARILVFETRTNFIGVSREGERVLIDSERYDIYGYEDERDDLFLHTRTFRRLIDYWMTPPEIRHLTRSAFAFAKQMAASPANTSLSLIPVVVSLEVCTVQKEGELHEAAMDRAICNRRLIPLYLYPLLTITEMPKPMDGYIKQILRTLPRARIEDTDLELAQELAWRMSSVCHFCSKRPCVAQITLLSCSHAFHSHCIVRWLEDNNTCPLCDYVVYIKFKNTPRFLKY